MIKVLCLSNIGKESRAWLVEFSAGLLGCSGTEKSTAEHCVGMLIQWNATHHNGRSMNRIFAGLSCEKQTFAGTQTK